jgi:hypothetical protein
MASGDGYACSKRNRLSGRTFVPGALPFATFYAKDPIVPVSHDIKWRLRQQ